MNEDNWTALHIAAEKGLTEVCLALLKDERFTKVDAVDKYDKKTALHIACEEGFEAVARALISADPSLLRGVSRSGHTPLELARERDFGSLARRLEALLV